MIVWAANRQILELESSVSAGSPGCASDSHRRAFDDTPAGTSPDTVAAAVGAPGSPSPHAITTSMSTNARRGSIRTPLQQVPTTTVPPAICCQLSAVSWECSQLALERVEL